MKTNIDSVLGLVYQAPYLEYLDCSFEGVLCQSSPAQGESWVDGGTI
jgi:hypothetical protein